DDTSVSFRSSVLSLLVLWLISAVIPTHIPSAAPPRRDYVLLRQSIQTTGQPVLQYPVANECHPKNSEPRAGPARLPCFQRDLPSAGRALAYPAEARILDFDSNNTCYFPIYPAQKDTSLSWVSEGSTGR